MTVGRRGDPRCDVATVEGGRQSGGIGRSGVVIDYSEPGRSSLFCCFLLFPPISPCYFADRISLKAICRTDILKL
jgi:hypothetical protein